MAFLDNSGDIILDAVLTDTGRKRMANGNFRITKFGLGDDEIDYGLYDINHASGSAYYDLEILQTPIFEATTGIASGIESGLTSYGNLRLLYLPALVSNEKIPTKGVFSKSGVYYLAINDGSTPTKLIAALGGANGGGSNYVLQAGQRSGYSIILETGLQTTDRNGSAANVRALIDSNGLRESGFVVSVDTRFFTSVLGPVNGDILNNNGGNGELVIKTSLKPSIPNRSSQNMSYHSLAKVMSGQNNIVYRQDDQLVDTASSAITGPRASWTALNFDVKQFTTNDFTRHGQTNVAFSALFPGDSSGNQCNYIDSMVKITGNTTGVTKDIVVRILKVN